MEKGSLLALMECRCEVFILYSRACRRSRLISQAFLPLFLYGLSSRLLQPHSSVRIYSCSPFIDLSIWSGFPYPYFSWLFSEFYSIALYHASLIQRSNYFTWKHFWNQNDFFMVHREDSFLFPLSFSNLTSIRQSGNK